MIKKRLGILVMVIMAILTSVAAFSSHDSPEKTIIVSVDSLDFESIRKIDRDDYSEGLLSLKAGGGYESSLESQFLTMATGRRVALEGGSFKGIERDGEKLRIKDYSSMLEQLDSQYKDFSDKMEFLGESFNRANFKTAYMGSSEDILLIADKSGEVDFGETEIEYTESYLNEKLDALLAESDLLLISYEIDSQEERLALLSSLMSDRAEDIMVFPKSVEGDIDYRLNRTIVPILYRDDRAEGVLTSDSTKREGIVSNLDIVVTLLEKYGIDQKYPVGNPMESEAIGGDITDHVEGILLEFLNLNIIKYVFHGLVISIQLVFILSYIMKRKIHERYRFLILVPMISVLLSLLLGLTPISKYLWVYIGLVIAGSCVVSKYLKDRLSIGSKIVEYLAIATNVFIFAFLYIDKEVLYNSFIGYNNIVAAGRFYGFNNDIMGVFIGTAIITYFWARGKERDKRGYAWILYLALIVISHTERYGSNFGGLLTSAFLLIAVLYCEFFCGKNRKGLFAAIVIGVVIALGTIVYIGGEGSHMGEFFIRVREYGGSEFWDMIGKKINQLLYMLMLPQWGIMVILQSIFLFKYAREHIDGDARTKAKYAIFYITAVTVLLVNDTGVVSFVYMMMYLVSQSILELDDD